MTTFRSIAALSTVSIASICIAPHAPAQCGPMWNTAIGAPGLNGNVGAMLVWDDGKGGGPALYVGGDFTTAGGFTVNGIAKWDGQNWQPLGPQVTPGVSGGIFGPTVNALAVWNDGTGAALYVAGDFATAGGVTCNGIAKYDGTSFQQFNGPQAAGVFGTIHALAVHQDIAGPGVPPVLYAGGSFNVLGVNDTNNIARWDGEVWSALGTGVNNKVFSLCSFVDNLNRPRLYVGGAFTIADGNSADYFAMWNGQALQWSEVGGGCVGWWVQAMKVWNDGTGPALFIGGVLSQVGSNPVNNVAKWDPVNGWFTLGSGTTGLNGWYIGDLEVYNDGTGEALYAAAYFDNAGGNPASKIAKWDGGAWNSLASGLNGPGGPMAVFDPGARGNPALVVGGQFTIAGGQAASHIAIWERERTPSSCPSDINCDGTVGSVDMSLVLGGWGVCP